jgi:exopolyphosphatase/guanosine-5'-triphosphate,3'-diphosphate pyrophosphatase
MIFAGIDVGTHAARFKMVRVCKGGALELLEQHRAAIYPGEGVFATGEMAEPAVQRLCATLRQFARRAASQRARVRAVATAALREARNRDAVVRRARAASGVELEVIDGREEAELVCLGVLGGALPHVRSLCVDVGGGSTEVVVAHGDRAQVCFSLALGSLRLAASARGLPTLRTIARESVRALPEGLGDAARTRTWLCSGTARAVASFATGGERVRLHRDELPQAVNRIAALHPSERRELFGTRRADTIVAGAVAIEAVVNRLGAEVVDTTRRGLRDGLITAMQRKEAAATSESGAAAASA